jgi:uncharacterized protein (TIGR02231 family)
MRRVFACLFVVSCVAWSHAVRAQDVTTRITEVTVYQQGAWVTRQARVDLQAGANSLLFADLSSQINQRQFQVAVQGDGTSLGQVKFDEVQQRDAYDAQVRELQAQIDAVRDEINTLADASQTAQLKLKFLDGIAQGYAKESWFEGARGNADVSSWRAALSVLDEGSAAARTTIRDNDKLTRAAKVTLSQLEREMQSLRGKQRVSTAISVTVAANTAQTATVRLRYFQRNASWTPKYTAYVDSTANSVRLSQQGQVVQQSDEDWRDVQLTLSTNAPSGELIAPEVQSEFLQLFDPTLVRLMNDAPQRNKRAASMAMEEMMVTADAGQVRPQVNRYSASYRVPGRVDVTNDAADAVSFDLVEMSFPVELVTHIAPRLSEEAFLVAKFTYEQDLPLYEQNLLVYVDQEFVGETWLPTALPGDSVSLPAGQDRRVSLAVQNQGGQKGESGFIGRRKTELTSNLFVITNRRDGETRVEVFDRYPTATHEDIEVSVPRSATVPTEKDVDNKPGVIVWRKTLAADETWNISHEYEVSYPADKRINANPG